MTHSFSLLRVPFVLSLLGLLSVGACSVGCAGWKAVDSTVAADRALDASQTNVQLSTLQGDLLGDPELAGKIIVVPTVPGKDVVFRGWHDNGQPKFEYIGSRSEVIASTLGRINEIDSGKFMHDRMLYEQTLARFDRLITLYEQRLPAIGAQPAAPQQNALQSLVDQLVPIVIDEVAKRKAANP